jgi:hypothetical protein
MARKKLKVETPTPEEICKGCGVEKLPEDYVVSAEVLTKKINEIIDVING